MEKIEVDSIAPNSCTKKTQIKEVAQTPVAGSYIYVNMYLSLLSLGLRRVTITRIEISTYGVDFCLHNIIRKKITHLGIYEYVE